MSSGTSDKPVADLVPHLIEVDLLDLEAFARVQRAVPSLGELIGAGSRLVPSFDRLALDVFAVYFKYNVVPLTPLEKTSPQLIHRVLYWLLTTHGLDEAKEHTRLDRVRAGLMTARTLARVLEMVRRREWFSQEDLLAQWQLERDQAAIDDLAERREVAADVREASPADQADGVDDLIGELDDQIDEANASFRRLSDAQRAELDRLPVAAENLMRDQVANVAADLRAMEDAADTMGSGLGLPAGATLADKLTLGDHLLNSDKLQQLARLVGLFKQVARSARKRELARRPSTVHAIEQGSDLGRLLSSELVQLRHPVLRRDLHRRLIDDQLSQYALQGDEPTGRGPMVVCVDASGSMQGPREIWAKAIALTLMEIARRERRAFRAVVFSGDARQCRLFELLESPGQRRLKAPQVDTAAVKAFAEYFPSGGTDFEAPLRHAVASLSESRFKDGDIVFVTDGGARLAASSLAWIEDEKARLGFEIFAVLVDLQGGHEESLRVFADDVLRVSDLNSSDLRAVFSRM